MTSKDIFGIIAYIVSVFLISLVTTTKATMYFVILVLIGVLFVNANKIQSVFTEGFTGGGGSSGGAGSTGSW